MWTLETEAGFLAQETVFTKASVHKKDEQDREGRGKEKEADGKLCAVES